MKRPNLLNILILAMLPWSSLMAQNEIDAWGEIKVIIPGSLKLPFGMLTGVSISLKGSSYSRELATKDEITAAMRSGRFTFKNVPFDQSVTVAITYLSYDGSHPSWQGTYVFRRPSLNLIQKLLSESKAREYAGYLGTFVLDEEKRQVTYSNKFE